ncbi:MAG: SpoVG family protein, partial [Deltaproteobacteria bacterium]|nr:SpoVG family protein [Deltaproteobacteria bacterium]
MPKNTTPTIPKYDVKTHSIRPEGSCKATASFNVYGDFVVRGIKVME